MNALHQATQVATTKFNRSDGLSRLAALALFLVLFAQLLNAATSLSATIDEGFHITSGYEYLRTGRMRLLDEHTPLVKALFAWPLFFVPDLASPEQAAGYANGDLIGVAQETVLAYRPIDRIIVACRVPVALLTLLLAVAVYRWAADWFGPTAGAFALTLLVFDPDILAHGSLATTDLGATAFIFFAAWGFARYLRRPGAGRWWAAALALGLAQGAKLTALLLLPVLGLLALADAALRAKRGRLKAVLRRALSYGGMVAVAALVVWALYLFEVRPLPGVAGGALPLPAASHVERWLRLQDNAAYGRESFLLGQNRMHGWWQYFPVAFVLKTPLPTLVLLIAAVATVSMQVCRFAGQQLRSPTSNLQSPVVRWGPLVLFPLVYAALSLTSTINIGYRHLLPILPFLFIVISCIAYRLSPIASRTSRITHHVLRITFYVLLAWLTLGTLLLSPYYLTYFNELAGGPDQGYRFLADSNTDWGQGLKELAEYQRRNGLGTVRLSLFTFLDPAAYGVSYEPIAPMRAAPPVLPRRFNPEPGLYAISATTLDGVPLPLPSTYDWFRHREPLAQVAHVVFLYRVEESRGEWVAQCTQPVVPLEPEIAAEGFGSDTLRQVYLDCTQSWVFPAGGASAGWYVLATPGVDRLRWPGGGERLEWWPEWVRRLPVGALRLSYAQPTPGELPAFAIWEWRGGAVARPDEPVALGDTLEFLGYDAPRSARPGDTVEVVTYWRVITPPARPLSLMLHLTGADGVPIAVGDGLGVSVDQWRAGDTIAQRHRLEIPAHVLPGAYQLLGGAYWLDDMTRLTATTGSGDVVLVSIEVGR